MYIELAIKVENYLAFEGKKPCREPFANSKISWSGKGVT